MREILGLSAPMNKIGHPTYLSNAKESLIVAAADIEGGHGLTMDSNYLLELLQRVIKTVKCWHGDNDGLNNFTPQVFPSSCQLCQLKG